MRYAELLTKHSHREGTLPPGHEYRLLTEAQWEYACRAGTTTAYAFGNRIEHEQANFSGKIGRPSAVGCYPKNAWGLHDMHGNVWEWCEDVWRDELPGETNPLIRSGARVRRVIRGGSWVFHAPDVRAAFRDRLSPESRSDSLGFRLAEFRIRKAEPTAR